MKASDYKKHANKKQITEKITLPSGAEWQMRLPNLEQWVIAGKLPSSLVGKMAEAAKASDGQNEQAAVELLKSFTEDEFNKALILGRELLIYSAVEPKVSSDGSGDTLAIEDILPDDFAYLTKYVWSGGKQGQRLETFRK
jgi:hypothetical protein